MTRIQFLAATAAAVALAVGAGPTQAALLTFDDAITGSTSYAFDGDGDSVADVLFTTTDPLGFNTIGPGPNQLYIDEPGLEGTTLLNPDLRVNFLNGAVGSLSFGFAVSTTIDLPVALNFSVFNAANVLIASNAFGATRGTSNFSEAFATTSFAGTAAYATFDFTADPGRYILDNFSGTFGSTETGIPEPGAWALMILGFGGVGALARRRREGLTHA